MSLDLLRIHNLRNVAELELNPGPGMNLVWGRNAAGKTTLLEAIYLLARGRSFRSGSEASLVRGGETGLELFGTLARGQAAEVRIGFSRTGGNTRMRLNGQPVERLSDVARAFPLQLMTPRSHEILERGPDVRRRFIEWGVFHVEPTYFGFYKRFRRALYQRNAALKSHPGAARAWEPELVEAGEALDRLRRGYVDSLRDALTDEVAALFPGFGVTLEWHAGWRRDRALAELLAENLESDRARGHTQSGPHRADFTIKVGGVAAAARVSRGQQKLLIAALQLAQARCNQKLGGMLPTILVDDIAAELDREHRERLLQRLAGLDSQVFVTSVECLELPRDGDVFHVEQGRLA